MSVYASEVFVARRKRCTKCKTVKERTEFHRAGNGVQQWCKVCRSKRCRAGQGPGVWPNERPMPLLPRTHREDGCPVCKQQFRFNTDADSALTQECACGTFLVPLKGRELVVRYDAGERHASALSGQVVRACRSSDGRFAHPIANTSRPGIQMLYRRRKPE